MNCYLPLLGNARKAIDLIAYLRFSRTSEFENAYETLDPSDNDDDSDDGNGANNRKRELVTVLEEKAIKLKNDFSYEEYFEKSMSWKEFDEQQDLEPMEYNSNTFYPKTKEERAMIASGKHAHHVKIRKL